MSNHYILTSNIEKTASNYIKINGDLESYIVVLFLLNGANRGKQRLPIRLRNGTVPNWSCVQLDKLTGCELRVQNLYAVLQRLHWPEQAEDGLIGGLDDHCTFSQMLNTVVVYFGWYRKLVNVWAWGLATRLASLESLSLSPSSDSSWPTNSESLDDRDRRDDVKLANFRNSWNGGAIFWTISH